MSLKAQRAISLGRQAPISGSQSVAPRSPRIETVAPDIEVCPVSVPAPLTARERPLRVVGAPAATEMRLEVVTRTEELTAHLAAWESLAAAAIEPNVFYEPWLLLPALEHLAPFPGQTFVLVHGPSMENPKREVLCGFFPLQTSRTETTIGLPVLGLLRHPFCYLRTPLLRAGCARESLAAFLDWALGAHHGAHLIELSEIATEGPFRQLLTDALFERGTLSCLVEAHTRALFRPAESLETYFQRAMSSRHRRDFGRKERRLGELGKVRYEVNGPGSDPEAFARSFLELEASGWKGRGGTAMNARAETRAFFHAIVRAASVRKRLLTLSLVVGERPVAQRLSFVAGTGAMAFKIAYDESLARHSPGVLLELENVRRLHATREVAWMDCGAVADNHLFNRVWTHRRSLESVVLASDPVGDLLVSAVPLLRLLNRALRSLGRGARAARDQTEESESDEG